MRTLSSLNRIGAACLGGLLLLALTARAQNSASPGKPSSASGSPGTSAMGGGALAPTGGGVASPQLSPNGGPTQPGIPLNNPQQTFKQQTLPDNQDLNAKNNLKAKFGKPLLGLEEAGLKGPDNNTAPPPPITLTPGVPVSIMVWDDTDIVHGTAPPPNTPDGVRVFLIRAKMNNVFPTGIAAPPNGVGGNVAGDKGVYLDRNAAPKKGEDGKLAAFPGGLNQSIVAPNNGGNGTPGIVANADGTLSASAGVSHLVQAPGPNGGKGAPLLRQEGLSEPSGDLRASTKGAAPADPSDPKGVEAKGTHTISASYPGSGGFKRASNPADGGDGKLPGESLSPNAGLLFGNGGNGANGGGAVPKNEGNARVLGSWGVDTSSQKGGGKFDGSNWPWINHYRGVVASPLKAGDSVHYNGHVGTVKIVKGEAIINWGDGFVSQIAGAPHKDGDGEMIVIAANGVLDIAPPQKVGNETPGIADQGQGGVLTSYRTAPPSKGGNETPGFKTPDNESPRPVDRIFVGDSRPGRVAAAQKDGFEKTFLDGSPALKARTEPTSGGTEKPGIFVRGAQPVIVNNEMASSPKGGNGTPGISDQAAGGVLTSYRTAPPPNAGGGKPPPFDGKDVNGDRHSTNDKLVPEPSPNGEKAIPTANITLSLNTPVTRRIAPQDGGDENGNRPGIIPAVQAQREAARRLPEDGKSSSTAETTLTTNLNNEIARRITMVAKGSDGKVLPYAAIQITDAAGHIVGTGIADEKGCVSWTPTTPGRFTMSVHKGDGSSNKEHHPMGIVTLVK